jgi:prephenate dehydrogenase
MMAVVQALNHLNTITLGTAIAATGIPLSEINKFSTPIFRAKMEIVKKYSPKARNFTRTSSVKIPILIKCWNSTKKRWLISAV